MKKIIIMLMLFIDFIIFAQPGHVESNHKVYPFLERLNLIGVINNYNNFETPKSHIEIKNYLLEAKQNEKELNEIDRNILNDLLIEFDFFINGSDSTFSSVFSNLHKSDYYESNKALYHYSDSSKFSIFINLIGENSTIINDSKKATIFIFGGELKGYLLDEIAFYVRGTNGMYKGDKQTALNYGNLRYNYKANLNPNYQGANSFFDDTESYLYFEKNNYNIKLGRDRILLGHGVLKPFIGNNPPPIDYFRFKLNYSVFSFTYLHGKLLSESKVYGDSLMGEMHDVKDKYLVYHRFELNFSKHFKLGIGEFIIYGNRSLDLSYLNPFNFYKSIEHINQDRDNSSLFIDISNNSFPGFNSYITLFIDDIDFGKIGKKWFGNQLLWDVGVNFNPFYHSFAGLISLQYIRIEPYVFTHRIPYNNFTSLNFALNDNIEPNSHLFNIKFFYYPIKRLSIGLLLTYKEHGNNIYDEEGQLVENYGGSIISGHRPFDKEEVRFLNGNFTKTTSFSVESNYEFIKNNFLGLNYNIANEKINNINKIETSLVFNLRIKI